MKNITVSVPDEVYYAARIRAAELRTSVSALVRDQLSTLAANPEPTERGKRILESLDRIRLERQQAGRPPFTAADNLTREQIYDPDLRRLERAHLQRGRSSE